MSEDKDARQERDDQLPTGEMPRPTSEELVDPGQPRQVAQVNIKQDEPLDELLDEDLIDPLLAAGGSSTAIDEAARVDGTRVEGGWGPTAWLLGLLALAISVGGLIFVLQGVFKAMPS